MWQLWEAISRDVFDKGGELRPMTDSLFYFENMWLFLGGIKVICILIYLIMDKEKKQRGPQLQDLSIKC